MKRKILLMASTMLSILGVNMQTLFAKTSTNLGIVTTGDDTNMTPYIILMVVAAVALLAVLFFKKKK